MSQRALTELLHGKGAHADPLACVEDLSAETAAGLIAGFPHSIGQIVFHMNYWMRYEQRRIRGERPAYPEHASESWPRVGTPRDAEEWDRLRRDLSWLLGQYAEWAESSEPEMQREIESMHEGDQKVAGSLESVLWQMVSHNSYHAGQIALLRRVMGVWPPRGGGDSW
jgi:uncharacterized damage-inducible protein DinB